METAMNEYVRIKPGKLFNLPPSKFTIRNMDRRKALKQWYKIVVGYVPARYRMCPYVPVKKVDLWIIIKILHEGDNHER